ncbi:GNAT family N-acetyltransferase [Salinilacihabitans rarus]|uniref:GNAT family N-acetyltransferase n=1 Tax=Salinilacihabitans rarus TaxID=2961596 RepID=UPI0020C91E6B|nr:GNAT family N-acetyltransferase [Salinilacihabitans rarus]
MTPRSPPAATPDRPLPPVRLVDDEGVTVRVRPYRPSDRDRLFEMYEDFDPNHRAQGIPPLTATRRENWLDRLLEEGTNFVAEREGRIVGHSLYVPSSRPEPELAVFVHQAFHGRGIGTALCECVVASAAARGRDALVLEVEQCNRVAVRLYRSLGFETVETRRGEMQMRLPLSPADAIRVRIPAAAATRDWRPAD